MIGLDFILLLNITFTHLNFVHFYCWIASAQGKINETVNGVIGENTTRKLEYDIPEAGATVIVTSTNTAIVRYSCKVQSPDDSTADFSKQFKGQTEYYAKCEDPQTGCFKFGFGKRQVVSKKLYVSLESLTSETSFTVNAVEGDVLTRDGKMQIYFIIF